MAGSLFGTQDIKISSKVTSDWSVRSKADYRNKNFEATAINIESDEKNYTMCSVECDYFGFGKLKLRGLFSEIQNPCGYNPGSEVFFTRTYLTIDKSVSDSGRTGIYVEPFPWLCFFSLWDSNDANVNGISLGFSSANIEFSCMFQDSHVSDVKNGSSWYLTRSEQYEGCELMNVISSLNFITDWFSLMLCGGTCFGDYVNAGFYNRDMLSVYCFSWLELNILFSGTTEHYLAPTGKIPLSQYKYGAEIILWPFRDLKLSCMYYNDYQRPDMKDESYNDFTRNLNTSAVFSPGDFRFSLAYVWNDKFANDGTVSDKARIEAGASYSGDLFYIGVKNTYYLEEKDGVRNYTTVTGKMKGDFLRGEVTYRHDVTDELADSFLEKIVFDFRHLEIVLSHEKPAHKKSIFSIEFSLE